MRWLSYFVGRPTTSGIAEACREANYIRDTINIRDYSSNRDNRNIIDVNIQ